MEKPPLFLFLDWDDFYWDVVRLSELVEDSGFRPDAVVAIARGGWVVGRILADLLDVDKLYSIRITYYTGVYARAKKPRIMDDLPRKADFGKALIADDVADTGETLRFAKRHLREAHGVEEILSATPYKKPWAGDEPDFYVRLTDRWIVFPHSYKEDILAAYSILKEKDPNVDAETLVSMGFDRALTRYILERFGK